MTEVLRDPAPPHAEAVPQGGGRWTVRVEVQGEPGPEGVRVQALDSPPLRVDQVWRDPGQPLRVAVSLARPLAAGDPGRGAYLLRLHGGDGGWAAFGVDLDPAAPPAPPSAPALPAGARIDYRARDFEGFRDLMLGYLSATVPRWDERGPADLGVALVELMAYAADNLSYMQDAAGTEAYLGMSRLRTSLRRHARLLDYQPSEGCSAAVWVQLSVTAPVHLPAGTALAPALPGAPPVLLAGSPQHRAAAAGGRVFETRAPLDALPGLNEAPLYPWGAADYVLPAGSTQATLRDQVLPSGSTALATLGPGSVLVLAQARSPATGRADQADPARRQAVRLVSVAPTRDARGSGAPVPLVDVAWAAEDALDFPLVVAASAGSVVFSDGARARCNVVLADHGARSGEWVPLGELAADGVVPLPAGARPLSRTDPGLAAAASAREALAPRPAFAHPAVEVRDARGRAWVPRRDLLASGPFSRDFVVEVQDDESASLRFGDGVLGMRPEGGAGLWARWRTGYGPMGNVGPDTLAHLVAPDADRFEAWSGAVLSAGNPVGASGGAAAEPDASIRARAPGAVNVQARCVTADDWAAAAGAVPGVRGARAETRWTGSWATVFVTVQPEGGAQAGEGLLRRVRQALEPLRPAGHDVAVRGPRWVPLEVVLQVTVAADRSRRGVEQALAAALGDGVGPDGVSGHFHPDRFALRQPVYLSPVLAAAMGVEGVQDVRALRFRRAGPAAARAVYDPVRLAPHELPRAGTTPGAAWRGSVSFQLRGGR